MARETFGRCRAKSAVGALAAALALTLSACAGGTGTQPAGGTTGAPDVVRESLTVGTSAMAVGLDPVAHNEVNTQMVYKLVNEALYRYTGPDEISPLLASDMPTVSEDGKTVTIPLKTGITFTNGDAFDADDVVFTFQTIMNPDILSANKNALSSVESVRAVDAQTVELTLKQPFVPLMYQLTRLAIVTSSIEYVSDSTYANTLVGTGPYKLAKVERGQEIVLEANEDFREEGIPKIPSITIRAFPDVNSLLAGMRNDQIQVAPHLGAATINTVEQFANVYQSDSDLVATRFFMWPNLKDGMMTDAKVRQAVAVAIDRGRVVDTVLRGYGYPISTLPSADEGGKYYSPLAQAYGRDPQIEKAKTLLQEAGATGKQLHLVVPQDATNSAVADSVQQQLEEIGFTVQREDLTKAAAFARVLEAKYDLFLTSDTPSYGDSGLDAVSGLYGIGGSYNYNGATDEQLSTLAREAATTGDQATIDAVRQRSTEYVPDVPIALHTLLTGLAKDLEGFEMYNYGDFYGLAFVE